MADVRFARLTKAWKHLKLSKSRQSKGLDWLRWDEDEDKEAEPSSHTLTLNCPMVYCMFECLQQLTLISIDRLSKSATQLALEVEQFYVDMEREVTAARLYKGDGVKKLFQLIRHYRDTLPPPKRVLKGCCKTIQERREREEKVEDMSEEKEEEQVCEEGGEEEELQDDPVVHVPEVKKASEVPEPVRRIKRKSKEETEDILYMGSGESKEKKELDAIRLKIKALELSETYTDHFTCLASSVKRSRASTCDPSELETQPIDILAATSPACTPNPKLSSEDLATPPKDGAALSVDPQQQRLLRKKKMAAISEAKGKGKGGGAGKKKGKKEEKATGDDSKEKPLPKAKAKAKAKGKAKEKKSEPGTAKTANRSTAKTANRSTPKAAKAGKGDELKRALGCPKCRHSEKGLGYMVKVKFLKGIPKRAPPPLPASSAMLSEARRQMIMQILRDAGAPTILLVVLAIVCNMPLDFKEEYEAVEFSNDDPVVSKALKKRWPTGNLSALSHVITPPPPADDDVEETTDPPPEQVHVLSLDPAPEFASETDDELLKYALHLNMVEVSSAEEDDVYGTPIKVAAKLAQLSKAEESKLEAILRRLCKADRKGNYQVPEQEGFLEKVNHTYRQNRSKEFKVRSGFYTDQMMADELKFTKDKYQKKLIWYWCDIAYEGTKANRDEEELLRDTTISDGARVRDVALGLGASLPDLDSQDEADNDADDDEDEDEEDDEEADEPKAKLGKRKSKDNLPDDVEEDMDGVPGLLNEMLSLQSRCNKLLDRDVESFKKLIVELGSKHDELADMKSAYDCEEPVDAAKLTKLINTANKKASRITMEENKIKKSGSQTLLPSLKGSDTDKKSEVPHEVLAELANAVVSEVNQSFGEEAATKLQSSSLLQKMGHGFTIGHAAQKTRQALDAMPENQAPLEVTELDIGLDEPFPVILFSSYLRALGEHNKLDILTQGVNLDSFWDKMQPLLRDHPIFQLPAEARARTIPLYLIGDEGRGWKKSAVFVLGSESLLGTGCDAEDKDTATQDMKMNFRGNTMVTRQLFACMPKNLYLNDDRPLHKLVDIWAEDFANLFYHGLDIRCGHTMETWRMILRDFGLTGCSAKGLDKNLAHLFGEMKAFAADRDLYLHMNALTKGMLGISSAADYPTGQWFKGADTTFVIKFLVFKFETVLPTAESQVLQRVQP
ncbi:hypothetical protein AK812_SmicGene5425 [Symbiodinium microadriaticum]|uniref:Uncharacterized protein n=1 Tax=Symbiodinium microadriaticum TaxID=2951 RepID=A0A1Q9ETQ5_SYMMI|nr:hypothetical protein AK812_SmicGene5425 [Symbiodinium microadriaticum]